MRLGEREARDNTLSGSTARVRTRILLSAQRSMVVSRGSSLNAVAALYHAIVKAFDGK
jgi:hypothetical protein